MSERMVTDQQLRGFLSCKREPDKIDVRVMMTDLKRLRWRVEKLENIAMRYALTDIQGQAVAMSMDIDPAEKEEIRVSIYSLCDEILELGDDEDDAY